MKNKNKIILSTALALAPIAIATPIIATSCSSKSSSTSEENSYQYDYTKNVSMFLSPDSNNYKFVTWTGDNLLNGQYSDGRCLSFQDTNESSATYKGWYLLLRDNKCDTNSKNDEIIASFCGWNSNLYEKHLDQINQSFTIPKTIPLPQNINIEGLTDRNIPVRAIGYSETMSSFIELNQSFNLQGKFVNYLFLDRDVNPNAVDRDRPWLPFVKNTDLSNSQVKYLFNNGSFLADDFLDTISSTTITFPSTLVYMEIESIQFSYSIDKTLTLDFSKTQLVEIKGIRTPGKLNVKLPSSCVRIEWFSSTSSYSDNIININLENVLYYNKGALSDYSFPNNIARINKKAQYVVDPENPRNNSFSPNTKIEFIE